MVTTPSSMGVLTRRRARRGLDGAAAEPAPKGADSGDTATPLLLAGGDTLVLLDLGDDAGVGVEEGLRHRVPASEIHDGEQTRRGGELAVGHDALHDRAVAVVREDLLGF